MTTYVIHSDDHRDIIDKVKEMQSGADKDAVVWEKPGGACMYMCSKLDWETVREIMSAITTSVGIAHTVDIPLALRKDEGKDV